MRGLHKSKRVSWASDDNLRQVKLFLAEEAPIVVGLGAQDHLQAKRSRSAHSVGHGSGDDTLPPGFDAPQHSHQLQINLSEISLIQWKPPSRFLLNSTWQIVAGEESAEAKDQIQREMRVLEAVYPRPSAIPQDPASSVDTEDLLQGDEQIPLIPITAIEDEEAETAYSITPQPPVMVSGTFPLATTPEMAHSLEPDVVAAASAAFTAIMKSSEPGSNIDQGLLIQILSNPKMIEKLVTDYGPNLNHMLPQPPETVAACPAPFYPHQNSTNQQFPPPSSFAPSSSQPPPPPRDMHYYKHLIHQHGGEMPYRHGQQVGPNPELPNSNNNSNPRTRDPKAKIMKPCAYFNSSRGCRNGANCLYQHDTSSLQQRSGSMGPDMQSSKRMKFDREITATWQSFGSSIEDLFLHTREGYFWLKWKVWILITNPTRLRYNIHPT